MHVPPDVLGAVGTVLATGALVPQVVRVVRTRCVQGLAWSTVVLGVGTFAGWTVYAAAVGDTYQLLTYGSSMLLHVMLGAVVARVDPARRLRAVLLTALGTCLAAALLTGAFGALPLAVVGSVVAVGRLVPQVLVALDGQPLDGVSPWWVGTFSCSGMVWTAYGLQVGDLGLLLSTVPVTALLLVLLACRLAPLRRNSDRRRSVGAPRGTPTPDLRRPG